MDAHCTQLTSSLYNLHHLFEDGRREINPKLLEVNYMGDWLGMKNALTERYGQESEEALILYKQWAEDMLHVLATSDDLTAHPRLKRLRDDVEMLQS